VKRVKKLICLIFFTVLVIGLGAVEKASADGIDYTVLYTEEMIEVSSGKQIYYQPVNSAEKKTGLRAEQWIAAAKQGNKYYIDYSSTSNAKDVFFALTTEKTSVTTDTVAVVDAVVKSFKVTLNYKAETVKSAGLADVISKLAVKGVEKEDNNEDAQVTQYGLIWKRGSFGTWKSYLAFDQVTWDMVKASTGTLYLSMNAGPKVTSMSEDGTVAEAKKENFRLVKEVKVKIPKTAKAPTVKLDYAKSTVGLKNGMQLRMVKGSGVTEWLTLAAYDKKAESEAIFTKDTTAVTSTRLSMVQVDELVKAVGDKNLLNQTMEPGKEYTFEVRTLATQKAFASAVATVAFYVPERAPEVVKNTVITYVKADKNKKTDADFKIDFTKLLAAETEAGTFEQYEYLLTGEAADETVLGTQKWLRIPEDGIVDLSKKLGKTYKYTRMAEAGSVGVSINYEKSSVIYLRKASVKEDKRDNVPGRFASAYAKIPVVITEKQEENQNQNQDVTQN